MNFRVITYASLCIATLTCTAHEPCNRFDARIHGGAEPLVWRNRGGIFGVNAFEGKLNDILGQCIPTFSTFFKTPWTVGGQIGYAHADYCWRLFLEGNYAQAHAKKPCKTMLPVFTSSGAPAGTTLNFVLHTYRFADGYIGAQYFFTSLCNTDFFIGAKIGCIHHLKNNFSLTEPIPGQQVLNLVPPCPKQAFIEKSTRIAGGIALGIDYRFCNNWHAAITGELIANPGPRTNKCIPVSIANNPTVAIYFGQIKSELRFPITLSLRRNF